MSTTIVSDASRILGEVMNSPSAWACWLIFASVIVFIHFSSTIAKIGRYALTLLMACVVLYGANLIVFGHSPKVEATVNAAVASLVSIPKALPAAIIPDESSNYFFLRRWWRNVRGYNEDRAVA